MVGSRYYSVADLVFCIASEAEQVVLPDNYAPFATTPVASSELLFELVIGQVQPASVELFYTDTSDDDMPRIEMYRVKEGKDNGWLFRLAPFKTAEVCAEIRTSEAFRQATLQVTDEKQMDFGINNAAMLLYAFTTVSMGVLEMHASVTVKDNRGYLFLGHSGTGKSTHSRLWQEAYPDAWLLNDDNPVLRVLPDGEVRVYGSPWSGKTPCYKQASVPVQGLVQLHQAPENTIRLLRLPQAYAYLLASCSGLKIIPEMMDALYATIARLIQTVPTYELHCLPNTDAARLCHDMLNK